MKNLLALALITTLATGCGGSSNNSPADTNSDNNPGGDSSQGDTDNDTTPPAQGDVTMLEGTWKKACGTNEEFYDVVTLTFTGNQFFSSIENYRDSSCTLPLEYAPNPTATGEFILGAQVVLSDGVTATEIDTHIIEFNGAPFDIDEYSVILVQNNVLYDGVDTADSPDNRPDALDYNRPFDFMN